jgi:hypothetical protein
MKPAEDDDTCVPWLNAVDSDAEGAPKLKVAASAGLCLAAARDEDVECVSEDEGICELPRRPLMNERKKPMNVRPMNSSCSAHSERARPSVSICSMRDSMRLFSEASSCS